MCKFKVGDTVFHVGLGVGKVVTVEHPCVTAEFVDFYRAMFTSDGKHQTFHTVPQLLTVEEARSKGYPITVKRWRWVVTLPDRLFLSDDYHTEERIGIVFSTAIALEKVVSTEIER